MKTFPVKPVALLLAMLPVRFSHGQQSEVNADMYSIRNGLSDSCINVIFQDSVGFLWIGTSGGLNKFDGYRFIAYRNLPFDTLSLSDNRINDICEGPHGYLWVGTGNGLNRFERKSGNFTRYLHSESDPNSLREDGIHGQAPGPDGSLWIKTRSYLEKLDVATGKISHFRHATFRAGEVRQTGHMPVLPDRNGKVWFGAPEGLFALDTASGKITGYGSVHGNRPSVPLHITCICNGQAGDELWVGGDDGLYRFSRSTGSFTAVGTGEDRNALEGMRAMCMDKERSILAGGKEGFLKIDPATGRSRYVARVRTAGTPLRIGRVNSLLSDRSGITWLGTEHGLFKLNRKKNSFGHINSDLPGWSILPADDISAVLFEGKRLWLGTAGKGLVVTDSQGNPGSWYRVAAAGQAALCDDHIHSLFIDRSQRIWVGTANGVMVRQTGTESFTRLCRRYPSVQCNVFEDNRVFRIEQDGNGNLWFATEKGVYRLSPDGVVFRKITPSDGAGGTSGFGRVLAMVRDTAGNLWFGTGDGLLRYRPENEGFERMPAPGLTNGQVPEGIVYSLFRDSRDRIWTGTAHGLQLYSGDGMGLKTLTEQDGMGDEHVYSIAEDADSFLWIATGKGLSRYDPARSEFRNYGATEGMMNKDFNLGAAAAGNNGILYFGGRNGLTMFHPDSIAENRHMPNIVFTSFEMTGRAGRLVKPLEDVYEIIIPKGNNVFTIHFSALDFTDPGRNRYRYRLSRNGSEESWIDIGYQHSVTFFDLPSGVYEFSVKGSNSDQQWNEEGKTLTVTIPTPEWKSTEAIVLYGLAALILIYLVVMFQTRRLRKSNRILREKDLVARQVERQKEELITKNKNITDSINYARRIQLALLPSDEQFLKILPRSFILYKPKDIVSGDFYWINENENKIFVGAVDCTGHGVPGAFVSIIGFELFRKITSDEGYSNPASILDSLNDHFATIFSDGEQVYLKDGMDLSLCALDKKEGYLEFSGAFNPLYLIRDETIIEIKADRFSVGADIVQAPSDKRQFKSHKIYLQKDDIFYMFSDGYADQFGGPEGKKFKYRRFRHLLLTIHMLPMDKQRMILDASIEEWKKGTDQVDDIMVIGIRPFQTARPS